MITYIKIQNGITHKNETFNFGKGVTVIHGENGRGKSLIQEFIRFALFGSKALRGNITEYPKDLYVELGFSVYGKDYVIKRSLSDCSFNGVLGTTACNKAIIELLGYDLSMFDMGNCAKQFEITSIGKMKPSERKSAVDKLIGIDIIDELIKEVKEEVSVLKGRLSVYEEEQEPVKSELLPVIEALSYDKTKEELDKIALKQSYKDFLDSEVVTEPMEFKEQEPVKPKGSKDNSRLKRENEKERERIAKTIPDVKYEESYLIEQCSRKKKWFFFEKAENPTESEEWVKQESEKWVKYKDWISSAKATCPNCGKMFSVRGVEEASKPESDFNYVEKQRILWEEWKKTPDCPKPELTNCDDLLYELQQRKLLLTKLANLEKEYLSLADEADVSEWEKYEAEYFMWRNKFDEHETQVKKYNAYENTRKKYNEIVLLGYSKEDLWTNLNNIALNKSNLENYESNLKKYEKVKEEIKKLNEEKDKYDKAIEGLLNIKKRIKLSVTPSLSRVATDLCYKMTDGVLNDVKITENFDILVNSRSINLFSGSEEAVANLAIRLALGRILTNKVLNIFIGDEIDASMDDERALLVSENLRKLKNQIDQIILISHKKIEADNYITL